MNWNAAELESNKNETLNREFTSFTQSCRTAGMEEVLVHFYNVITGKCACGAKVRQGEKTFSVFPERVSCGACLRTLRKKEGKSEGKSG